MGSVACAAALHARVLRWETDLVSGILLLLVVSLGTAFFVESALRLFGCSRIRTQIRILLATCIVLTFASELVLRFATDKYASYDHAGPYHLCDRSSWFHLVSSAYMTIDVAPERVLDIETAEEIALRALSRRGYEISTKRDGDVVMMEAPSGIKASAVVDTIHHEIRIYPDARNYRYNPTGEFLHAREVNSLGLAEREISHHKPAGEFRIIALGDSFTEGIGTEYESTWVKTLERVLRVKAERNVVAINAGVRGSDPFFEYILLEEKLLPLHPDLVIVAVNVSDVGNVMLRGGFERFRPGGRLRFSFEKPDWAWAYGSSYIFRAVIHDLLRYDHHLVKEDDAPSMRREAARTLEVALRAFRSLAEENGFDLIIAFHPDSGELKRGQYETAFGELVENTKRIGDTAVIDVLDSWLTSGAASAASAQELYWPIDKHHNEKGYRLMGETIADCVLRVSLIEGSGSPSAAAAWSSWRGPDGNGCAPGAQPPTKWSETKNVRWKVPIPGLGSSSPIIWGDRVYLTTAIETVREGAPVGKAPKLSPRMAGAMRPPPTRIHEFVVLAVDRKDGRIAWRTKVNESVPHEVGHNTSTQASGSPITDGQHIYAFFGSRGLHCLDMKGERIWSKDLGRMKTLRQFGEGSSPVMHGNTLVVNWDHEGDSFIVALDKSNGDQLWRQPRDEGTSWMTPVIATLNGRAQVVTTGRNASRAYDLETGKLLWSCRGMTMCIATPVRAKGMVYLMSGLPAEGSALQAIDLATAKGDLTGGKSIKWSYNRNTPYVSSPLLYDGYLYFLRMNAGVLTCLDAATGKVHYEGQRLRGLKTIYSSPIGAGGHVYITSRGGRTRVLEVGPKLTEVASNELDGTFDATPAVAGKELFLRSWKHLYCIADLQ